MSDRPRTSHVIEGTIAGILAVAAIGVVKFGWYHVDASHHHAAGAASSASSSANHAVNYPKPSSTTASTSAAVRTITRSPSPLPDKAAPKSKAALHPVYNNIALIATCDYPSCANSLQVGDRLFNTTNQVQSFDLPNYGNEQAFPNGRTSCKRLIIRFAGDQHMQEETHGLGVSYLKFIQTTHVPIYAHVQSGHIGTVTVPLDGGPLTIDAGMTNDGGMDDVYVEYTVTGEDCSTPDGVLT